MSSPSSTRFAPWLRPAESMTSTRETSGGCPLRLRHRALRLIGDRHEQQRRHQVDHVADEKRVVTRAQPGPATELTLFDGTRLAQEADAGTVRVEFTGGDEFTQGAVVEIATVTATSATVDGSAAASWWTENGSTFVEVGPGSHVVEVQ